MSTKLLCTQNSQQRQMIPLNETYGRDSFVLRSRLFPPKFNPIRSPLMLIIGPLISLPLIALCSCPSSHSIFVPTKAGIGISEPPSCLPAPLRLLLSTLVERRTLRRCDVLATSWLHSEQQLRLLPSHFRSRTRRLPGGTAGPEGERGSGVPRSGAGGWMNRVRGLEVMRRCWIGGARRRLVP
jgi:hypothetical protein